MDKPVTTLKDLLSAPGWDYAERRKDVRFPCQLPGIIVTARGPLPCEITSLSSAGLSVRCSAPLEKGEEVEVRQKDRSIKTRVEWASKASFGMMARLLIAEGTFEGSWLQSELSELGARAAELRQRRGAVRVGCHIPATLSWEGERRQAVLRDLGTTGAGLDCEGEPLPDQPLSLTFGPLHDLPRIAIRARLIGAYQESGRGRPLVEEASESAPHRYGVAFNEFLQGGPQELLGYMNQAFTPKRA